MITHYVKFVYPDALIPTIDRFHYWPLNDGIKGLDMHRVYVHASSQFSISIGDAVHCCVYWWKDRSGDWARLETMADLEAAKTIMLADENRVLTIYARRRREWPEPMVVMYALFCVGVGVILANELSKK